MIDRSSGAPGHPVDGWRADAAVLIAAPQEDVWAIVSDFSRLRRSREAVAELETRSVTDGVRDGRTQFPFDRRRAEDDLPAPQAAAVSRDRVNTRCAMAAAG